MNTLNEFLLNRLLKSYVSWFALLLAKLRRINLLTRKKKLGMKNSSLASLSPRSALLVSPLLRVFNLPLPSRWHAIGAAWRADGTTLRVDCHLRDCTMYILFNYGCHRTRATKKYEKERARREARRLANGNAIVSALTSSIQYFPISHVRP